MKKLKISGFCLFLLVSSASFAQTDHDKTNHKEGNIMDKNYESWDSNKDKKVDQKEFTSTFDKMDSFKKWDANNDKGIDEKEWEKGIAVHNEKLNDQKLGSFKDWDVNGDKKIDRTEFTEGNFKMWDKDKNGYVDSKEYTACHKSKM